MPSKNVLKPNFTMIPNYVFDTIFPELNGNQSKVFTIIIRHTTGWNQNITKINQGQIAISGNMTRQTVKSATEYLAKRNLIDVYGNKKIGLSYSYKLELKEFNYGFKTVDQMLKNLTSKKDIQMLKNLTSDVKKFNIPYILNTSINTYIKKYIKKNEAKSLPKSKRTSKSKKQNEELGTLEVFEVFKSKFDFIDFENYKKMIAQLEKLNGVIAKNRITKNLEKLKFNKGRFETVPFSSVQFGLSVKTFCDQDKYQGIWVVDVEVEKAKKESSSARLKRMAAERLAS